MNSHFSWPCHSVLVPCFLLLAAGSARAQVALEHIFPPAIQVGKSSLVTAEGKFPSWPVSVYCDRPDITVTPAKDSGKLEIQVPQNAQQGIAWLRLHDAKSASNLAPILIERTPVETETEPNDRPSEAKLMGSNIAIAGRLEKRGDVDTFQVQLNANETLVVTTIANQ
ncbi:MAG: hypothetical protein AAF483_15315, partial [Planctomycetota bacterium]